MAVNGPTNGTARDRRHLYPVTDTGTARTAGANSRDAAGPAAGNQPAPTLPGAGVISPTDATSNPTGGGLAERMAAQVAAARAWLPPLEPAVFDCYLGELAGSIEPYSEADPVAVMASLLAAAGVHVGPGPHLPIGMERHPLVVWPLLIGHTGSGRKGTAWGAAKHLLTVAAPEFVASNVHSGLSSGEGLAAVFATDNGQQEGDDPRPGQGKRTATRRARLLPDNDTRLLAYEPEWASVMARMKREGNTLSATLRAAWEGGNLSTLNVDARVARHGHVGILAHITPGEFKAKVTNTDLAGGTYNRFLPVAVAQSKFLHLPTPPDPHLITRLAGGLADRLTRAREFGPLALSEPARDAWAELYLEFATHPHEHAGPQLAEFTSRAAAHCLRIAALHAALDTTTHIQPTHLTAAAALVRYSIATATTVLHPNENLAKLAAFITAAGPDGCSRTEITAGHFKGKPPADMAALLDRLVQAEQVTTTERPRADGKTGRRATVYTARKFRNFELSP